MEITGLLGLLSLVNSILTLFGKVADALKGSKASAPAAGHIAPTNAALGPLYTEVVFNLEFLENAAPTITPSKLLLQRCAWDGVLARPEVLSDLPSGAAAAMIASAYWQLELAAQVWEQDEITLFFVRVKGADQQLFAQLRIAFVAAEEALRPLVFDTVQAERMGAIRGSAVEPQQRGVAGRLHNGLTGIPLAYPLGGVALWWALDRVIIPASRKLS